MDVLSKGANNKNASGHKRKACRVKDAVCTDWNAQEYGAGFGHCPYFENTQERIA